MTARLQVIAPGPLTTVQDQGRPGYGATGVSASGAADRASLAAANRLVGNRPGAAGLETTMGGLTVRAHDPVAVAVTGPGVAIDVDGTPVGSHCRIHLRAGQVLAVSAPSAGLRNYVAVRGGIVRIEREAASGAREVFGSELGSLSSDYLSGLGQPPVSADDQLLASAAQAPLPAADLIPHRAPEHGSTVVLPIVWGPRDDWFTPDARRLLVTQAWTVSQDVDRVGVRVGGAEPLARARGGELASEPMVTGALQVPADGQPVVFLADHPVTGGYPVIAVVRASALGAAAQLRPGDDVRFSG
ncbi:MAG: biotin-dependent carboxyltransferase family protein [Pseudonocardia sp.]|nr:biotin-dependent carboxyltransferase family protein [Pseudonocardia sp.]